MPRLASTTTTILLLSALLAFCVMAAPGSPKECYPGYFQCSEGLCIPESLVCDGELNCITGNDEGNCLRVGETSDCFPGYFQCSMGNCIPGGLVCDGEYNCVTGNDELFC